MATLRRRLKRQARNIRKIQQGVQDTKAKILVLELIKAADPHGPQNRQTLSHLKTKLEIYEMLLRPVGKK